MEDATISGGGWLLLQDYWLTWSSVAYILLIIVVAVVVFRVANLLFGKREKVSQRLQRRKQRKLARKKWKQQFEKREQQNKK